MASGSRSPTETWRTARSSISSIAAAKNAWLSPMCRPWRRLRATCGCCRSAEGPRNKFQLSSNGFRAFTSYSRFVIFAGVVGGGTERGTATRLVVLVLTVGVLSALEALFIGDFVVRGPESLTASPATVAPGNAPAQTAVIH